MNLVQTLQDTFRTALTGIAADPAKHSLLVKPAQDAKFGDYQANMAMSLAKELGKPPRQVAEQLVGRLNLADMLESPQIAGPGFINLRFRTDWLATQLQTIAGDDRLGVSRAATPRTYVIDYSSPNVAKPLHAGHLRSTIIGDALKRSLRFLGHQVIADNHLGDWGTQFGMLIYGYKNFRDDASLKADPVGELVRIYLLVRGQTKAADKEDDDANDVASEFTPDQVAQAKQVLDHCREETAKLQAGDEDNLALWKQFIPWSMATITPLYEMLGVTFDHFHGESFYNPMLSSVVDDLLTKKLATESRGAVVVFLSPPPDDGSEHRADAVIRKRDGAFTYTTSDLATIQYRMNEWKPDAILYVVGMPQSKHFQTLFAVARRWGYDHVSLNHVAFGSVLGNDRKMLSTRNGGAAELSELLETAIAKAEQMYESSANERKERGQDVPDLSADERRRVAKAVGLGAVKYADLSQHRTTDYVFLWDKMLAMEGNTATYMQYAYARCRSIFRKAGVAPEAIRDAKPVVRLANPFERALALQLLKFEETLASTATEYLPHIITSYLWDLAKSYSGFFQNCPVVDAPTSESRAERLLLCDLTARTIRQSLELLGIEVVERM